MQRLTNLNWLVVLFATGCLLAQPALAHCCVAMAAGQADATVDDADCPTHPAAGPAASVISADIVPTTPTPHCYRVDLVGSCDTSEASSCLAAQRNETGASAAEFGDQTALVEFARQGRVALAAPPRVLAWSPEPKLAGCQRLLLTQRWRL